MSLSNNHFDLSFLSHGIGLLHLGHFDFQNIVNLDVFHEWRVVEGIDGFFILQGLEWNTDVSFFAQKGNIDLKGLSQFIDIFGLEVTVNTIEKVDKVAIFGLILDVSAELFADNILGLFQQRSALL